MSAFYSLSDDNDHFVVDNGDKIYNIDDWFGPPVVLEEYNLIFFATAKVACTTWFQLFRRMMGRQDWQLEDYKKLIPWNPKPNGLRYLYDYDLATASAMMTSPDWTRAIFVREPKERFLSAYLNKAIEDHGYVKKKCCPHTGKCAEAAKRSPEGFLNLMHACDNAHWMPQSRRMEAKHWKYINFVGHQETVQRDSERLLRQVGAWEKYGSTGWGGGATGNRPIFHVAAGGQGRHHATNASNLQKMRDYIDQDLEMKLDMFYASDYAHPVLNISKIQLY